MKAEAVVRAEAAMTRAVEAESFRRLRIGVDLDEVLAELVVSVLDHHHEQTGERYHRDAMSSYNFWDLLGGTREDAIALVDEFYGTDRFRDLEPVPGAIEAVWELSRSHELVVITSRPHHVTDHTHTWLDRHFPGAFAEVHLTNHWSDNGQHLTKSEVCDRLGIDVMIEDSVDYASECAGPERPVILLECPWNQGTELPEHVARAGDWPAIQQKIAEIAAG